VAILDNWWDQCTPFRKGTTQWLFGPHLVSFHPVVLMKILRFKTFYLIRSNGKVIRDIFRRGPFKEYHIQDWSNICLVVLKKIEMWKVNGNSRHVPLCRLCHHPSRQNGFDHTIILGTGCTLFLNKRPKGAKMDVSIICT
jgi:hypothetical protein